MTAARHQRSVVIDCFPESLSQYANGYAIVAIDVIRATTTAVTAVTLGRQCFAVQSVEEAVSLAPGLPDPLLVGELGGSVPYGFHLQNSPASLALRTDLDRPVILLSTSGTRLMRGGTGSQPVYVACLRNYRATAAQLNAGHPAVAIIGAGARGEFREEDQLGCAWVAELLLEAGYAPEDGRTVEIVRRWKGASIDGITLGASAEYLRRTGQLQDLDFILGHVDDVDDAFIMEGNQVVAQSVRSSQEILEQSSVAAETVSR